jgi:hypothetical protein
MDRLHATKGCDVNVHEATIGRHWIVYLYSYDEQCTLEQRAASSIFAVQYSGFHIENPRNAQHRASSLMKNQWTKELTLSNRKWHLVKVAQYSRSPWMAKSVHCLQHKINLLEACILLKTDSRTIAR